jgi:CRISPR-associated protein Csb2
VTLVIACEFLTGVCVAADHADRDAPEWPPHPARLYSALVASWGDAGEPEDERAALDALERLGPPEILAPTPGRRDVATQYVPPNDASMGKPGAKLPTTADGIKGAAAVVPALRGNRQPRTFPATPLPDDDATVRFVWPDASVTDEQRTAINALASRVSYLGHSTSLVRVALEDDAPGATDGEHWTPAPHGRLAMRVPSAGRRAALKVRFAAGRRPDAGAVATYARAADARGEARTSAFGDEWYVLRSAGGLVPALEAWPYVSWVLRRALLALVDREIGPLVSAEERAWLLGQVSGHQPDGTPADSPHVAIVPMANVGWARYSTGAILGAALVLPRDIDVHLLSDAVAAAVTRGSVTRPDADAPDGRAFVLTLGELGEWWLSPAGGDARPSLSPARYGASSTTWTTVTPLVLDRFPKRDGDAEEIIAAACAHAGLPIPTYVRTHKHAAVTGAPAARPRPDVPTGPGAWRLRWRDETGAVVERFRNRPMTHATITFDEPVRGPVLVGAGRYHGLGLCLPSEDAS